MAFWFVTLFLLCAFCGCSYHPRDAVQRLPPRPNVYVPQPAEDFVYKPAPDSIDSDEISSVPVNKKTLIVIDAGHGGDDLGTKSPTRPKYHEKSLNLTTAFILNDFLQRMGYQTIMTRTKDEFVELKARAEFANDKDADLFVSVHYNSAPAKEAEGIEVFYFKGDNKTRSAESRKLASSVLSKVTQLTKAKSRGVKHGNFAVIRETNMPAILVEGGFLTNEEELEKIKDPAYVKMVAWGIAKGIQAYIDPKKIP